MRGGTLFGLIVSVFLILFFPVAPIQWLSVFFLFIILLSKLYTIAIRRSLSVARRDGSVKVFKFQPALIEITVTNNGLLPIPYLAIVDDAGNFATRDQNKGVISLRPHEHAVFAYTLKGHNRGIYEIGPVQVRLSDPLGFFPWRYTFDLKSTFVVYPSVYPDTIKTEQGVPSGSVRVWNPVYEDITNYRSVREYVPGDDPRRINWKVSARTGTLQTMQYLPAISFPVMILLDLNLNHFVLRSRYQHTERAIEAAASLVQAAVKLGQSVGIQATAKDTLGNLSPDVPAATVPIAAGFPHAMAGLELLARVKSESFDPNEGPIEQFVESGARLPTGCWLCYVGPALSEARRQLLAGFVQPGRTTLFYVNEGIRPPDSLYDGVFRVRWITASGDNIVD